MGELSDSWPVDGSSAAQAMGGVRSAAPGRDGKSWEGTPEAPMEEARRLQTEWESSVAGLDVGNSSAPGWVGGKMTAPGCGT